MTTFLYASGRYDLSGYTLFDSGYFDVAANRQVHQQIEEAKVDLKIGSALAELRNYGLIHGIPKLIVLKSSSVIIVQPDFPRISVKEDFSEVKIEIQGKPYSHSLVSLLLYYDKLFKAFTFEPSNGWHVFNYMDLASANTIEWSLPLIEALDENLTRGLTPEVGSMLAKNKMPLEMFTDFLNLPYDWAARIAGEDSSSDETPSIYYMLETVDEDELLRSYGYPD